MAIVKGIGGAFIYSNDAARLAAWYRDYLGLEMDLHPNGSDFYRVLRTRDIDSMVIRENPVFAIRQATQELPENRSGFMLNLRVDDLLGFLQQLRAKGVGMEGEVLECKHGKHAWIKDLDGNQLELYEEILEDAAV